MGVHWVHTCTELGRRGEGGETVRRRGATIEYHHWESLRIHEQYITILIMKLRKMLRCIMYYLLRWGTIQHFRWGTARLQVRHVPHPASPWLRAWCPSNNSFLFQSCNHTSSGYLAVRLTHSGSYWLSFSQDWSCKYCVETKYRWKINKLYPGIFIDPFVLTLLGFKNK